MGAQPARVRSISALVDDLRQRDVGTLVFESRQGRNDVQDRRESMAAEGGASCGCRDAVAGAVGDDIARQDPRYVEMLPDAMCHVRWLPGSL